MATSHHDTISGQPIAIVTDAKAWQEPDITSWWSRCREINRLLRGATHVVKVDWGDAPATWFAGSAGTSLAAGIEHMAVNHERLRDGIVALALDERIYTASLTGGLVREEWFLYPNAFTEQVQAWRSEGRTLTRLTGGGTQDVELPNAADIPVDIDTDALTLRHASFALISAGLLRWRDGVLALGAVLLASSITLGLNWWRTDTTLVPVQDLVALVTEPAPPARFDAAVDVGILAHLAATHDAVLWDVNDASRLEFDPAERRFTLHMHSRPSLSTVAPAVQPEPPPPLVPYTLRALHDGLADHLHSSYWSLTFGPPYAIGSGDDLEQHVTIAIGHETDANDIGVAYALVKLTKRLRRLPVTLHHANCAVQKGAFQSCELQFAIRGLAT